MITIEECRRILGKDGKAMSSEDIQILREWLYMLAVTYNNHMKNIDL